MGMIVPEGQTDGDRIRDFVAGTMDANRAKNRRADKSALTIAAGTLAYKLFREHRKSRRAARRNG